MERRKPYTKMYKSDEIRADHVKGMGDVVFKGFQCLNSKCEEFIFVRKDELGEEFEITCPSCSFVHTSDEEAIFYNYKLKQLKNGSIIEEGTFTILHDEYIDEAQDYKYCIICNTMKPLDFFDRHSSRKSKRQGECRLCKAVYNDIKNQTRLTDQHREAAQKRRMYLEFTGTGKIESKVVFERFGYRCFKCGKNLENVNRKERPLDHTLPAMYLWPLTTENATLLCRKHNGEKAEKWPREYYSSKELKTLSVLTGIRYEVLSGPASYNPDAMKMLQSSEHVDSLLSKYAAYMGEIIKLRNRILADTELDFFQSSKTISPAGVSDANKQFKRIIRSTQSSNAATNIDEK